MIECGKYLLFSPVARTPTLLATLRGHPCLIWLKLHPSDYCAVQEGFEQLEEELIRAVRKDGYEGPLRPLAYDDILTHNWFFS